MKNIFLFSLLSLSLSASSQYPLSQNGYLNTNGKQYGWSNVTDTIAKVYTDRFKLFKPLVLPGFATGAEPTSIRNSIAFHSDSTNNALFYIDAAGGVHNFGSIGGSGSGSGVTAVSAGYGMTFSTITSTGAVIADSSVLMTQGTAQAPSGNKTFTGVVNLNGGGNAYIQGGNSFGATASIGTKDANQINFISNNAVVASLFTGGQMLIGNTGVAPSQKLYVKGTLGLEGTITTAANSGFSVLSGFNFSSFAANNGSNNIGFLWGMNNAFTSGTKSFMTVGGDASLGSGTSSVTQININPVYNSAGSGGYTLRGIYYNPTLTSLTNTTHIAFENVSGNNRFNSTSGTSTFFGVANFSDSLRTTKLFNKATPLTTDSLDAVDVLGYHFKLPALAVNVAGENGVMYNSAANAFGLGGSYLRDTYLSGAGFSKYEGTNASNLDSFAVFAGIIAFNKVPIIAGAPTVISYTGLDHYAQTNSVFDGTNAPIDGEYEMSGWVLVNSATSSSIKLQVTFNDHNNVTQTIDLTPNGATTVLNSIAGYYVYSAVSFRAKAGVAFGVNAIKAGSTINYDFGWTIKELRP